MTKYTKNIKIRIISCLLSVIAVFSVGAVTITSASAAVSKPAVDHQITSNSIYKTVEQYFLKGIDRVVLKTDTTKSFNSVLTTNSAKTVTKDNYLDKLNDLRKDFFHDHNLVKALFRIIGTSFNQ